MLWAWWVCCNNIILKHFILTHPSLPISLDFMFSSHAPISLDIRFQHCLFVFVFNVLWLQFFDTFHDIDIVTIFQHCFDIGLWLFWVEHCFCILFLSWWWKRVITCFSIPPLTFFLPKNLLHFFNFVCFQLEV